MTRRSPLFTITPLLLASLAGAAVAGPSDVLEFKIDESRLSELLQPAQVIQLEWDDELDQLVVEEGGEAIRVSGVLWITALWRADGQPLERDHARASSVVDEPLGDCPPDTLRLAQAPRSFSPSPVDVMPLLDRPGVYQVTWRYSVSFHFGDGGWQGIRAAGRQLQVEVLLDQPRFVDDMAKRLHGLADRVRELGERAKRDMGPIAIPHGVATYLEASLGQEGRGQSADEVVESRRARLALARTHLSTGDLVQAAAALRGLAGEDVLALRHAIEVRLLTLSGIRGTCDLLRKQSSGYHPRQLQVHFHTLVRHEQQATWSRCAILHLELAQTYVDTYHLFDRDWTRARAAFQRARAIDPDLAASPQFERLARLLR